MSGVSNDLLVSLSMNYQNSGNTNEELVANLKRNGLIRNKRVQSAMRLVDRGEFCTRNPYEDKPQSIGFGATISSPHMHAIALETLEPFLQPGNIAMDVGCGSGYLTVCMSLMVGDDKRFAGLCVGIDHTDELVDKAISNTKRSHQYLYDVGHCMFRPESAFDLPWGTPGVNTPEIPPVPDAAQADKVHDALFCVLSFFFMCEKEEVCCSKVAGHVDSFFSLLSLGLSLPLQVGE